MKGKDYRELKKDFLLQCIRLDKQSSELLEYDGFDGQDVQPGEMLALWRGGHATTKTGREITNPELLLSLFPGYEPKSKGLDPDYDFWKAYRARRELQLGIYPTVMPEENGIGWLSDLGFVTPEDVQSLSLVPDREVPDNLIINVNMRSGEEKVIRDPKLLRQLKQYFFHHHMLGMGGGEAPVPLENIVEKLVTHGLAPYNIKIDTHEQAVKIENPIDGVDAKVYDALGKELAELEWTLEPPKSFWQKAAAVAESALIAFGPVAPAVLPAAAVFVSACTGTDNHGSNAVVTGTPVPVEYTKAPITTMAPTPVVSDACIKNGDINADAYRCGAKDMPFDYNAEIMNLPEVRAGLIDNENLQNYQKLVGELYAADPGAARFVVNTGRFLEDRKVSPYEIDIVHAISKSDDPLLMALTPEFRKAIGPQQIESAKKFKVPEGGKLGYLTTDIKQLKALGLVKQDDEEKFGPIMAKSVRNLDTRILADWIKVYGVPDQKFFNYKVLKYNTQLYVALNVIGNPEFTHEHDNLALETGMVYGPVVTVGNEEVQASVLEYANKMFDFVIKTDEILAKNKFSWRIEKYPPPVVADILWGATGTVLPVPQSSDCDGDNGDLHTAWSNTYNLRQMDMNELSRNFVTPDNLAKMRDMFIKELPSSASPSTIIEKGFNDMFKKTSTGKKYDFSPYKEFDHLDPNADFLNYIENNRVYVPTCPASSYMPVEGYCPRIDNIAFKSNVAKSIGIAATPVFALKHGPRLTGFSRFPTNYIFDPDSGTIRPSPADVEMIDKYNENSKSQWRCPGPDVILPENIYISAMPPPTEQLQGGGTFTDVFRVGPNATDQSAVVKSAAQKDISYIPAKGRVENGLPPWYLLRTMDESIHYTEIRCSA